MLLLILEYLNFFGSKSESESELETKKTSIGDRMKSYESIHDNKIYINKNFIVRLDGRCFSKFTKRFKTKSKPFNSKFAKAMIWTMQDLVKEFGARTGYTHSDEISLIFSPDTSDTQDTMDTSDTTDTMDTSDTQDTIKFTNNSTYIFNGRTQKLLSLCAAYCSVRFIYHYTKLLGSDMNEKIKEIFFKLMFDARIISFDCVESKYEIVNYMVWRSIHDCSRNCLSTYTRNHYSANEMKGKKYENMVQMLKSIGIQWENDVPVWQKYGVYWKQNGARIFKIKCDENTFNELLEKKWYESTCVITKNELDEIITSIDNDEIITSIDNKCNLSNINFNTDN